MSDSGIIQAHGGEGPTRATPIGTRHWLIARADGVLLAFRGDLIGDRLATDVGWASASIALLRALLAPSAVAIDVGANVGAFTLPFARAVGPSGRVVAIEPRTQPYRLLAASMTLNGLDWVELRQAVAGRRTGWASQHPPVTDDETNIGARSWRGRGSDRAGEQVPALRLDDLTRDWRRCDLIKLDVEGMEPEVLAGAAELIARTRPVLFCEANRADVFEALLGFAAANGYRAHDIAADGDRDLLMMPDGRAPPIGLPLASTFDAEPARLASDAVPCG
jgi:FkbM family methyltransferase